MFAFLYLVSIPIVFILRYVFERKWRENPYKNEVSDLWLSTSMWPITLGFKSVQFIAEKLAEMYQGNSNDDTHRN